MTLLFEVTTAGGAGASPIAAGTTPVRSMLAADSSPMNVAALFGSSPTFSYEEGNEFMIRSNVFRARID